MGIILYEMATGERPFKGDSATSVLSSILKDTPILVTELNPKLPRDMARIVRRCLVKDVEHRYQTAKDLRNELEELKQEIDSRERREEAATISPQSPGKWLRYSAMVAIIATVSVVFYQSRHGDSAKDDVAAPATSTFRQLTSLHGPKYFPSFSPNADFVAYTSKVSGNWDIYLQRVGGETPINLTEASPTDDTHPAFSPNGEWILLRASFGRSTWKREKHTFLMRAMRFNPIGHPPAIESHIGALKTPTANEPDSATSGPFQ